MMARVAGRREKRGSCGTSLMWYGRRMTLAGSLRYVLLVVTVWSGVIPPGGGKNRNGLDEMRGVVRMRRVKICVVFAGLLALIVAAVAAENPELSNGYWLKREAEALKAIKENGPIEGRAKNVILFIGDGMGISTVTAARIFAG